ncbi:uncharacterized protein LOC133782639 [Humulus lupulus]|uniref:uncharacterized protein LOC133782639 n=1 Tax=Humulus lupulus TaxID=3486 RepID=UPI002B407F86|nr:uncharacterized protein LOC133782639 [Humulus lupulus]
MGYWDYITTISDSLKNSYGFTKDAVTNIGSVVKDNSGKVLTRYGPDEETKSKIIPFATSVAKYSAEEGLKFVPGGVPTYNVLKKSINALKESEGNRKAEVKNLEDKIGLLEKEVEKVKKLVEEMEGMNKAASLVKSEKTENVVRVFMMDDFMGMQFFNSLYVTPKKEVKAKSEAV